MAIGSFFVAVVSFTCSIIYFCCKRAETSISSSVTSQGVSSYQRREFTQAGAAINDGEEAMKRRLRELRSNYKRLKRSPASRPTPFYPHQMLLKEGEVTSDMRKMEVHSPVAMRREERDKKRSKGDRTVIAKPKIKRRRSRQRPIKHNVSLQTDSEYSSWMYKIEELSDAEFLDAE